MVLCEFPYCVLVYVMVRVIPIPKLSFFLSILLTMNPFQVQRDIIYQRDYLIDFILIIVLITS